MATLREIRRRIRSVQNISQVTRAMQMVSASKMRRAQEQALATREYSEKAWELLVHLASRPTEEGQHPLLEKRPVACTGLVLITADKGLAGGYNHNIIRRAVQFIRESQTPVKVMTIGRRGRDFLLRLGVEIIAEQSDLPSQPRLLDVLPTAHVAIDDFEKGVFDEVYLAYTLFHNTMNYEPVILRLLPIYTSEELQADVRSGKLLPDFSRIEPAGTGEYIYEPDVRALLDTIVPRFTELQIYQAVLESLASEHSARMVAMRNATDNAQEMIEDLTGLYNRLRQEAITNEILDIAGGAEALAQLAGR